MRLDRETRRDFPILERTINGHPLVYLDSAASSQKPRAVVEAMVRYYESSHANVHRSIHTLGEEATEIYEAARDRVQRFIGAAHREEVIFTRGTTDSIGLVAEAIGATLACHRTTVAAALESPVDVSRVRDRGSQVDAWSPQIETWVTRGTPIRRMLELAREGEPPYTGSRSAFYARVSQIRETVERAAADALIRFEGLPGEFLQVD